MHVCRLTSATPSLLCDSPRQPFLSVKANNCFAETSSDHHGPPTSLPIGTHYCNLSLNFSTRWSEGASAHAGDPDQVKSRAHPPPPDLIKSRAHPLPPDLIKSRARSGTLELFKSGGRAPRRPELFFSRRARPVDLVVLYSRSGVWALEGRFINRYGTRTGPTYPIHTSMTELRSGSVAGVGPNS